MGGLLSTESDTYMLKAKEMGQHLDYISTNLILTSDFQTKLKLADKAYCNDLIVLTADILQKRFTNIELQYLAQRTRYGAEVNEMATKEFMYLTKDELDDVEMSVPLRKKRACIAIAKFYVQIAHVFAACMTTLKPMREAHMDVSPKGTDFLEDNQPTGGPIGTGFQPNPMEAPIGTNPMEAPIGTNLMEAPIGTNPLENKQPMDAPIGTNPLENKQPMGVPIGTNPLENKQPIGTNPLENKQPIGTNPLENKQPIDAPIGVNPLENKQPMEAPIGANPLENKQPIGANPLENKQPIGTNPLENKQPMGVPIGVNPLENKQPTEASIGVNPLENKPPIGVIKGGGFFEPTEVEMISRPEGLCGRRIAALQGSHPRACDINADKTSLDAELGIPKLRALYVDDYDYATGDFVGMTADTAKEFEQDLALFYKVFTGKTEVPPTVRDFSDISLRDFAATDECTTGKFGIPLEEFKDNSKARPLLEKYAENLRKMMRQVSASQRDLMGVINELFTYVVMADKKRVVRVHPALTESKLQDEVIPRARRIIMDMYTRCETDYLVGVKIYQAIVETKIQDTTIRQINTLEREKMALPLMSLKQESA